MKKGDAMRKKKLPEKSSPSVRFSLVIPPDIYEEVIGEAINNNRTVAGMVRIMILYYLRCKDD